MSRSFDAVIIGAGFSGLAAGIRLAHFGKRVLIVEKHTVWGGLNSFYKKGGHHFDTGLHAVTNYVRPGYKGPRLPLQRICRQLRIGLDELALEPQTYSQVVFGSTSLKFTNELGDLESAVASRFPGQVDGFRRLSAACASYPDLSQGTPHVSARRMLGELISDPLLASMLLAPVLWYGSAEEHDIDWEQFIILFNSIYREGFARPRRGVKQILELLVGRYEGEMKRKCGVEKLVVEGGRVAKIVLEGGEEITADVVLSSAGLVETMRLRSDAVSRPDDVGKLAFVETIWVLDAPPPPGACVTFFNASETMSWAAPSTPVDLSSGVICCPTSYAHAEPPAEPVVRATHLADPAFWFGADSSRYAAEKTAASERSLAIVSKHLGVALKPVYVDAFTPKTVKFYTGKENGAIYGSPRKLKTGATDVSNLFLCGTDQGLAGIVGAMLSGINIANLVLGDS